MKTFITWILPALMLAACLCAQEPTRTITAGPFSIAIPSQWAASAYAEKILARPLYSAAGWKSLQENPIYSLRPGFENRPHHWAIRFPSLVLKGETFDKQNAGTDPIAPQMLIHQTDGWATVFETGVPDLKKAAETRKKFRKSLDSMETDTPNFIIPAFVDGGPSFVSLKKKLIFKGGHGYRLLCQWTYEPGLVRRGGLHYLFVGLSDDDSCQIIATFPVDSPDLPTSASEEEHLGYSVQRYNELSQNMQAYSTAAIAWIEQHEKDFTPSLDTLDRLIESLSAETWR